MQIKASSMISQWITAAVMNKIIESKEFATVSPRINDDVVDFILDEKKDEQIKAITQPQLWFVNSRTVNWKAAEKDIISSLSWDDIQIGEPTETEYIIEELIAETSAKDTSQWVYELFLENSANILLSCTLVHALSHIDYELIYPYGPMMAMAMLSHDNKNVVSFAIKAFSNWNSKDSLKYVKNFSPKQTWAKKEWDRVVNYIEENGDEVDGVFNEKNYSAKMDTRTA